MLVSAECGGAEGVGSGARSFHGALVALLMNKQWRIDQVAPVEELGALFFPRVT